MQPGKAVVVVAAARLELEGEDQAEKAAESLDEIVDFGTRQEMTSCGALSSA